MPWPEVEEDSPFCETCGWLDKSAEPGDDCTSDRECDGTLKRAVEIQPEFFKDE